MHLPAYTANAGESPAPRKKRRRGRIILALTAGFFAAATALTLLTPYPVSFLARAMFQNGVAAAPDGYALTAERVSVEKNLRYPSKYKDNTADIYLPKNQEGPFPVVLWVHGGAFVGGDKKDIEIYATALAAEGFAVVSMNYRRAPEAQYPTPVIQTVEAYRWLTTLSGDYPLDLDRLVLAGDSAGAHIAAQVAAIQTNGRYANEMAVEQAIPPGTLKAVLLFCGPFDVSKLSEIENPLMSFLLTKTAQAYFGRGIRTGALANQATIPNHVTNAFPPAFISDGNTGSLENHSRGLADTLAQHGVPFETYFIPLETETAKHEYQFIMNTPAGKESFLRTLVFLKKHV